MRFFDCNNSKFYDFCVILTNFVTTWVNGIKPVIPPPRYAIINDKPDSIWHDKIVNYIKTKGTIEAQFSRIKRCIGSSLLTEKDNSKKTEGFMIGNIVNLWNLFGQCEAVKIG